MRGRGFSLLAWDVPAEREEPFRRFLQELSGSRSEEYAEFRRRLGISAESIWLVPRPSGGGVAVVYLGAEDPGRALRELANELATPNSPFTSWYGTQMRRLFGCDLARLPRVAGGELLMAWREAPDDGARVPPEDTQAGAP
jgi:hypothetical protein